MAARRCVGAPRNDRGSFPLHGESLEFEDPVEAAEKEIEAVIALVRL